jgi:hypothetical protein
VNHESEEFKAGATAWYTTISLTPPGV